MLFPSSPQPSQICLSHSYFQSGLELLVSWLRLNSKPCVGKIVTLGDLAKHTSEMIKIIYTSPSLWENVSQYILPSSLWPWRLWPNFISPQEDWGTTIEACNCPKVLLGICHKRGWCQWLVSTPNWPNGIIFSCVPGFLLPLLSRICSVKKLSWGQAEVQGLYLELKVLYSQFISSNY